MFYTKPALFALLGSLSCAGALAAEQAFETEQYQKALWMTTRFYGAQRSGYGPNWLTANHVPTNVSAELLEYTDYAQKGISYVKDADKDGYDLVGGWWDCADFVKFGQTEFYSAYMLLLGYSEFPNGYGDHYSADYNGYISSDDYTWEGKKGVPNGIPDILDEVKYATDYFIKCMRSVDKFYYQVGDGGPDHKVWCTSVFKSALPRDLGGELEGSRNVYSISTKGTSMVALCGASLAAMSRLYRQYDAAYADKCLEKARLAWEFIDNSAEGNIGSAGGTFYGAKNRYEPDVVLLMMELYRATGEKEWLEIVNDRENQGYTEFMYGDKTWNHGYTIGYHNTEDLAYYMLAMYGGDELAKERLTSYVNVLYKPTRGYILNKKNNEWGMLRYPANQAFVYGLYNKMIGNMSEVDPYALASIEYIMGSNSENYSFITGFGENGPKYPHYRNIFLDDSNDMDAVEIDAKHSQLGYLVGGSFNPATYPDEIGNYKSGEGGIDYNAGLVGALGYINSILAPVAADTLGSVKSAANDIQCYLYPNPTVDVVMLNSSQAGKAVVSLYNVEGQKVMAAETTWEELAKGFNVMMLVKGVYTLTVESANGKATKQFIKK